jgi:hypothetical protein
VVSSCACFHFCDWFELTERCVRSCLCFGLRAGSQQVARLSAQTLCAEMAFALGPLTSKSNAIGQKWSQISRVSECLPDQEQRRPYRLWRL